MTFHLHLDTETVEQAYPWEPLTVRATDTVQQAVDRLNEVGRGGILVVDDEGVLVGIFTERDALRMTATGESFDTPVAEKMTSPVETVHVDDTVGTAIRHMSTGGYRRMPMIDAAGKPVGVVSVGGILRYLVEHFPKIVYTLPPRPHHSTQEREGA